MSWYRSLCVVGVSSNGACTRCTNFIFFLAKHRSPIHNTARRAMFDYFSSLRHRNRFRATHVTRSLRHGPFLGSSSPLSSGEELPVDESNGSRGTPRPVFRVLHRPVGILDSFYRGRSRTPGQQLNRAVARRKVASKPFKRVSSVRGWTDCWTHRLLHCCIFCLCFCFWQRHGN